jgi:uncharacterized membrane protein YbhN (UPF0104 family)
VPTLRKVKIRVFSSASDAERARRPTDAVLVVVSILAFASVAFVDASSDRLVTATTSVIDALPGLLGWFWEISETMLVLWALVLLAAAVAGHGRLALFRDQCLAILVIAGAAAVSLAQGTSLLDGLTTTGAPPIDPAVRLAFAVGVIATTGPHLARPLRRVGRWAITLGALAEIALVITTPLGVIESLALGFGAAAVIHLVFGSPGGRPSPGEVQEALRTLGVDVAEVHPAALSARGVGVMDAVARDGRTLQAKVYGRDAWDGQLLAVTWSYLWYRDDTPNLTLNRLQQVEHEAFLTLLAERAGVRVHPVVAAGMAEEDALLVVEVTSRPFSSVPPDEITDDALDDLWRSTVRLHDAGIAHGALDDEHIGLTPDGTAVLGGFGGAAVATQQSQLRADRTQLLVTTALHVGEDRAVASALSAIGREGLAELLPFIQRAALTRSTRATLKARGTTLDVIRTRAADAAETEPPKLQPLRRVTWSSLLIVALLIFATWAVFTAVSDVGLSTIASELAGADAAWLWFALAVSPLAQVAEAFSTMGACPRPLRLGPAIGLQFAIRFVALAVPTSAGRVALNVRFFQRAGLSTSPAIAVGLVDSVAGFVVQVFLLVTIWIAGLATLTLSTGGLDLNISSQTVVAIVIGAVVVIACVFTVPKVRNAIRPRLAEAAEALAVLRTPSKVLELFAGNLAAQVVLAAVLGLCLRAFGEHATLAELILVNTLASLLSGVLPVPGGIGVMEAAIGGGLVAIGIPQPAAVSAAILYRLITFYLPPIWGAYAMRVLRRRGYL